MTSRPEDYRRENKPNGIQNERVLTEFTNFNVF